MQWKLHCACTVKVAEIAAGKDENSDIDAEMVQLDWTSNTSRQKNNFPANQKGYDTFETIVGKVPARRIQIFRVCVYLGIILKVILNNFQNNA